MSVAGPLRVARFPFVGPLLVGLLLGASYSRSPKEKLEHWQSSNNHNADPVQPEVIGHGDGDADEAAPSIDADSIMPSFPPPILLPSLATRVSSSEHSLLQERYVVCPAPRM